MGAACSTSPSPGRRRGELTAAPSHRCQAHSHRSAQHSSSPYPKSPLARLHSFLPSSPFPILNGVVRLPRGLLRVDPALSPAPSVRNAVVPLPCPTLHSHLYVSVLTPADILCDLLCRTPTASFAFFLQAPFPSTLHPSAPLTLPLHVAYHYLPRHHHHHHAADSAATSTRQPSTTWVHSATTSLSVTLVPSSDPGRQTEAGDGAFPTHLYTARMSDRQHQRFECLTFNFLPRLRAFLLDATRHPAFVSPIASDAQSLDSFPMQLSAFTDSERTGLQLSFPALSHSPFHADIEWKREQPRVVCRELGLLIDDADADHSLACFIARAWTTAAGAPAGEDDWRRLSLDLFSLSPAPLTSPTPTKATSKRAAMPSTCCPPLAQPLPPPVSCPEVDASDSALTDGRSGTARSRLDRRFLRCYLREYAVQYAGTTMLHVVVTQLNPQTLLTPKRAPSIASPPAAASPRVRDEGNERRMKQGVVDMLGKVLEAMLSILHLPDEAPRVLQWAIDVVDALLHVLCLHSTHHNLVHTSLAILRSFLLHDACLQPMQRMLNHHLAHHPLCQGCLLGLFHLLHHSPAFARSCQSTTTLPRLLSIHSLASSLLLPESASLPPPPLPSLPPLPPAESNPPSHRSPSDSNASATRRSSSPGSVSRPLQPLSPLPPPKHSRLSAVSVSARPSPSTVSSPLLLSPHRPRSSSAQPASALAALPSVGGVLALTKTPTGGATTRSVSFLRSTQQQQQLQAASVLREEEEKRQTSARLNSDGDGSADFGSGGVRGILKNSPHLQPRMPPSSEEEQKEADGADISIASSRRPAGASSSFSPPLPTPTLRPHKSKHRIVHRSDGGEEEKVEAQPAASPTPSVVIPKLMLSLAFIPQSAVSAVPAPLSSMRHSRRMSRVATTRVGQMKADAGFSYQGLSSPGSVGFAFPSSMASPMSRMPTSRRFSILDPPDPSTFSFTIDGGQGMSADAEGKAALRRLKDIAVSAGECFVTSQLATLLWCHMQRTQQDVGAASWALGGEDAASDDYGGWKRKETISLSSMPLLHSQRSAQDATPSTARSSALPSPSDLSLFYCAVLSVRCLLLLLAAQPTARQRAEAEAGLACTMVALTWSRQPLRKQSSDGSGCVAVRLPSSHLRHYQQLLSHTIRHCTPPVSPPRLSSASPSNLAPSPSSFWWLQCAGSAAPLPLLSTAGLRLAFSLSFASGPTVCLLPTALCSPTHPAPTAPLNSTTTASTSSLTLHIIDEDGTSSAQPLQGVVATRAADAFLARKAVELAALVQQLALLQPSTPHQQAVQLLHPITALLHTVHHYAIHSSCRQGLRSAFSTSTSHSLPPTFSAPSSSAVSCECGNSIALLLHTCGPSLLDVHGQLSRIYRQCKEQASAAAALQSAPVWSPVTSALSSPSSSPPLEVERLSAVNALIELWSSLLSHPSSHSTEALLLRLVKEPSALPSDSSQLLRSETGEGEGRGAASAARTRAQSEPKAALFSVLDFVHDHALLVYASSAAHYSLFVQPAATTSGARKVVGDAVFHSQRASLASTRLQRASKAGSSGAMTGSGRDVYSTAPSSAHSTVTPAAEEEEEVSSVPVPQFPVVHAARLYVLDFYRAVAWLLQRVAEAEEDADDAHSTEEMDAARPPRPTIGEATARARSSRREAIAEEEEADGQDSDVPEPSEGEEEQEDDEGLYAELSPRQRRQERRIRQARSRRSTVSGAPAVAGLSAEVEVDALEWYWSSVGELLASPHALIARLIQLQVTGDGSRSEGELGEEGDSDNDEEATQVEASTSRSSGSLSSLSSNAEHSSPRPSSRHARQRLAEFDLLASYSGLWGDLLGWKGAQCPFLLDEKLMDSLARLHFIAFIRNYHAQHAFDALKADTCTLHLHILLAVATATSTLLTSPLPPPSSMPLTRARRGSSRADLAGEDDASESNASPRGSAHPHRALVDGICGAFQRLRVVHFLSRELNAEHDTFVARSYLTAGVASSSTVMNSARGVSGVLSPQLSRGLSLLSGLDSQPRPSSPSPALHPLTEGAPVSSSPMSTAVEEPATRSSPALPPLSTQSADAVHVEHRRSASSPVNALASADWALPAAVSGQSLLLKLSLIPLSRLDSASAQLATPLPTHPEEEDDDGEQRKEHSTPLTARAASSKQDAQAEEEEEEEEDEEEDEAELSGGSDGSQASLQEETAMRREHADEGDGDFDELTDEAASAQHSRLHAPHSERASLTRTSTKSGRRRTLDSTGALKRLQEGQSHGDEDGGDDDEELDEYEASDLSVSASMRAGPMKALTLALPASAAPPDVDEQDGEEEGTARDDEDEDDGYDASELSSARPSTAQQEEAPPVQRPRFQLNIAPAQSVSAGAHQAEEPEQHEENDGEEADDDDLADGWSDSESLRGASTPGEGDGEGGLKLRLIIPSSSLSTEPSPSSNTPSLSLAAGGSGASVDVSPAAPPNARLSLPLPLDLDGIPEPSISVGVADSSSSAEPTHTPIPAHQLPSLPLRLERSLELEPAASTPPADRSAALPPLPSIPRVVRHQPSLSLHLPTAGPPRSLLTANSVQPTKGVFLLDPTLPGVPDGNSPVLAAVPRLLPPPLSANRASRGSFALASPLTLQRQSSSPSQPPLASSPASSSSAGEEGRQVPGVSFSLLSSAASPLPSSGRRSLRGKSSFGVKLVSASDVYAKQRQQRRLYEQPALHVAMLRLLLRLLIDPSESSLSLLYCDRALTAANSKADADVDVLTSLHSHLNHPLNSSILPSLFSTSLTPHHSSPLTRLLKLLCEPLFPTSLFLHPSSTQIGRGQFAQVYLAHLPHLPHPLAVKQIDMASTAHQRVVLFDLFTEVSVMERMRGYAGVVGLVEYGVSRGQYYLVMEAMSKSMKGWREEVAKGKWGGAGQGGGKKWASREVASPCFNEAQLMLYLYLFRRILHALQALHGAGVVHFDLKLDNVLIDLPSPSDPSTWVVAIADFGESLSIQHGGGSLISRGTENIQSPEMLLLTQVLDAAHHAFDRRRNHTVDAAADVWSLGCLFYELLTNRFLFEAADGLPIVLRVTRQAGSLLSEKERAMLGTWGGRPNRALMKFLQGVLVHNKDRRPTLAKVEGMFEAMVKELFPRGLHVSGQGGGGGGLMSPVLGGPSTGVGKQWMDVAHKREKHQPRSLSVQMDMHASAAAPFVPLPSLKLGALDRMGGAGGGGEVGAASPHGGLGAVKSKKMGRLQSSRRLSILPSTPPLSLHYTPVSEELQLPIHRVLPSLCVGARHGKATSLPPADYFCSSPWPCTHFVQVRIAKHVADTSSADGTADSVSLLTFQGWHRGSGPVATVTAVASTVPSWSDEPLLLLSSPQEVDEVVEAMREAVAMGGRVLLFVDADDAGQVHDDQQDSLRGLCCAYLMAVYGLPWLEAACLVHEKLPISASPADAARLTAAMASSSEQEHATVPVVRRPRESLFRPSIIVQQATAVDGRTRSTGLVVSSSKLSASFAYASLWPLRVAPTLLAWTAASTLCVTPELPVSYHRFVATLSSASSSSASLVTHRCMCGACLLTCSAETAIRRGCRCYPSPSISSTSSALSQCPTAPLGCRWFEARSHNLYGRGVALAWRHVLQPPSAEGASPPTPHSSRSTGSVPYSVLTALRAAPPLTSEPSSCWRLFECRHCLYPLLGVLPSQPSSQSASLTHDPGTGSVRCDGVEVRGLQVLAGLKVGGAVRLGVNHSSPDDGAYALDRRPRAFSAHIA